MATNNGSNEATTSRLNISGDNWRVIISNVYYWHPRVGIRRDNIDKPQPSGQMI